MIPFRRILALTTILFLLLLSPISLAQIGINEDASNLFVVGYSESAHFSDLQDALDTVPGGSVISLEAGQFIASPTDFDDPLCGNCLDPSDGAFATTGFVIRGKSLTIIGQGSQSELYTNAGYGVYIEDCPFVRLTNLAITGGERDQDGNATDAAVVVRRSTVEIDNCEIYENEGDYSETVAGIGGIMGREGAMLDIHNNRIHDNSWDGIALYRGAFAQIRDNEIWNGRGAGIGITWDSDAFIFQNEIYGYWKGIGSFGNTTVGVYNNFVHDLRGWGIVATGTSAMICRNNTVVRCGNVGIAGWSLDANIEIVNNIVAFNGELDQWVAPRVGIWMNCALENFIIENNCIFGNHDAEVAFHYVENDDDTWGYWYERVYDGVDGNFYDDPMLSGDGYFLQDGSPCVGTGNREYLLGELPAVDVGATGGFFKKVIIDST